MFLDVIRAHGYYSASANAFRVFFFTLLPPYLSLCPILLSLFVLVWFDGALVAGASLNSSEFSMVLLFCSGNVALLN